MYITQESFYNLIEANQINWEIFNHEKSLTLERLDLCYTCKKVDSNISVESFSKQGYQKF
jgi:hypothetical protein